MTLVFNFCTYTDDYKSPTHSPTNSLFIILTDRLYEDEEGKFVSLQLVADGLENITSFMGSFYIPRS